MAEAKNDAATRLNFLIEAFDETPYSDQDYLGLMFDYDVYHVPKQRRLANLMQKKDGGDIEIFLVNSGMIHLATMYSMLPSKEVVPKLFSGLIGDRKGDKIGNSYAQLTSVDSSQIVDSEHLHMLQRYSNRPEALIVVGRRPTSAQGGGEIEWEAYDKQKHGSLAKLNAI